MTPQERELVTELFDRLATLESAPRDADAERAVAEGLTRAPHAVYALVQTALVQDEALKRANARIQELEGGPPPEEHPRGFLDNMRDALLGRDEPRGSVPRTGGLASSGAWGAGAPPAGGPPPMPGQPYGQPYPASPFGGGGGSFLGTAAASAAGVIGGSMLLNGIRSMFGHSAGGASALSSPAGSPWSGGSSAANSDLARQAGIDDIGNERTAARDRDDDRSSLLGGNDQDNDNDRFNNDDDDTDLAGDSDDGDSDTA